MRTTYTLVKVASVFTSTPPDRAVYGYEIVQRTQIKSGTLHPLLNRLEREGWLTSQYEPAAQARAAKRPPRRYYTATPLGRRKMTELIASGRHYL